MIGNLQRNKVAPRLGRAESPIPGAVVVMVVS